MSKNNRVTNPIHRASVSRREVLKGTAVAAAGAALPGAALVAQTGRPGLGPIDVHQHYQDPAATPNGRSSLQEMLDLMGKNNIATVILSGNFPDQVYGRTPAARTEARRLNEYAAKLVSDHPKSLGFFATIPFLDADGSLKEIEYAFDTLKADGVGFLSTIGDKYPGDPAFRPPWEELNRRKAVMFLHPLVPSCCATLINAGGNSVERDFDTTRAVTNLLYTGTLSELPDIRYIINHSGACVPVLAGRIKDRIPGGRARGSRTSTDGKTPKTPNGVFYELKKLYYEVAHAAYEAPLTAMMKFAPPSQYLFGTDYPAEDPASTLEELAKANLPANIQRALYRENAERLFPRLKA
jgi:6-methylsalicylate decarboxylase